MSEFLADDFEQVSTILSGWAPTGWTNYLGTFDPNTPPPTSVNPSEDVANPVIYCAWDIDYSSSEPMDSDDAPIRGGFVLIAVFAQFNARRGPTIDVMRQLRRLFGQQGEDGSLVFFEQSAIPRRGPPVGNMMTDVLPIEFKGA